MMDKILAAWGTPRTRSTAFLWMMKQRGDFHTFHEPFGKSFYLSEDRRSDRADDQPARADMNYSAILSMLESHINKDGCSVFIKDLTYHMEGVYDLHFLSHFHNVFLIRDPIKTIPSLYTVLPDFAPTEVGYDTQYHMYTMLCENSNTPPLVIDADDLVHHPRAVIGAFCEEVGIPFIEKSLHWENIPQTTSLTWWIGGDWHHDNLKKSTGFHTKRFKDYPQVSEIPKLISAYDYSLPYFQKLFEKRLIV